MKKAIVILNEYLSHFWFITLLLIIGCLSVVQFSNLVYSIDYWEVGKINYLSAIFGNFLSYFFLPLSLFSIIIASFVWFKDKTGNNKQGILTLLLAVLTPCFIFLCIIKLSLIEHNININHSLSLPIPTQMKN